MAQLFDRRYLLEIQPANITRVGRRFRVTYGSVNHRIRDLRLIFNIERDLNPDPDRADIQIYNYTPANWSSVKEGDLLTLRAGYASEDPDGTGESLPVLFKGNMRFIIPNRRGPDRILRLGTGDGDQFHKKATIFDSFSGVTPVKDVIDHVVDAVSDFSVDLFEGFDSSILTYLTAATSDDSTAPSPDSGSFQAGRVVADKVEKVLTNVMGRQGAQWKIQNNTLVVVKRNSYTSLPPITISPRTGLIGSPIKTEKGGVSLQSLLRGPLVPGRRITLESELINGTYIIQRLTHDGDNRGSSWYTSMEAIPQ